MATSSMIARDDIIAALRLRYDFYSAENVLVLALARAGLADAPTFDARAFASLRDALARVADRAGVVLAQLDTLEAAAPPPPPAPVAPPAPAPPATTIALTGVEVGDGVEVLVCGNVPALGEWDPTRAAPMIRSGDAWLATIVAPPGAELDFKFLRRGRDGAVAWEDGSNRIEKARPHIDAVWR